MAYQRDLEAELAAALLENQRLVDEIRQLKEHLAGHSIPQSEQDKKGETEGFSLPLATEIANVTPPADKDSKVELFRSLFRGREDVYAEGFRMKDGKWGYRPAGCGFRGMPISVPI